MVLADAFLLLVKRRYVGLIGRLIVERGENRIVKAKMRRIKTGLCGARQNGRSKNNGIDRR